MGDIYDIAHEAMTALGSFEAHRASIEPLPVRDTNPGDKHHGRSPMGSWPVQTATAKLSRRSDSDAWESNRIPEGPRPYPVERARCGEKGDGGRARRKA